MIRVTGEPFDPAEVLRDFLSNAGEGAIASFIGTVRGDGIKALSLDHYPGFTEKQLAGIVDDLIERHRLGSAAIVHRFGRMRAGEVIMFAATAAPHRRAALDALDDLMNRLKTDAPFWKKELRGGVDQWLEPPGLVDEAEQHRV